MIRLSHNSPGIRKISRRRRISNQLAAFAAVMLFASTQVDFPGQSDDAPASTDPVATWQETSTSDEVQQAPESDGMPQASTTQRITTAGSRAKRSTFSLFLFRG